MTPGEIREARLTLGHMWGLGRPLSTQEVGMALRMAPGNINKLVLDWEAGAAVPSGPVTTALTMMLAGAPPPDLEKIRERAAAKLSPAPSPELTAQPDLGVMRRSGLALRASRRTLFTRERKSALTDP